MAGAAKGGRQQREVACGGRLVWQWGTGRVWRVRGRVVEREDERNKIRDRIKFGNLEIEL